MNEANEIMFFNFLTDPDSHEGLNQQYNALFEKLIDAGELDGMAVADLKVDTLCVGFYAGIAAAHRLTMAKIRHATHVQRQLERSRGEA